MKANQDKLHFPSGLEISTNFQLPDCILKNSTSQKRLGGTTDKKLNFNEYITNLSDEAIRKIPVFTRIC